MFVVGAQKGKIKNRLPYMIGSATEWGFVDWYDSNSNNKNIIINNDTNRGISNNISSKSNNYDFPHNKIHTKLS